MVAFADLGGVLPPTFKTNFRPLTLGLCVEMVYISEDTDTSVCSSSNSANSNIINRSSGPRSTSSTSTVLPVPATFACAIKCPPCRVCNGRGDGVHYGVHTCSACKSFFGRQLKRPSPMQCRYSGTCPMSTKSLKRCTACRLHKCLAVGMSQAGIRIGRTNYIQVTAAIEEVKRLELQMKIKRDGTLVTPEEHTALMDEIIHRLQNTHFVFATHTDQFMRNVWKTEQVFIENKKLEEQLYGQRRMLLRSEYNSIYQQTAIDIDGRQATMKELRPVLSKTYDMLLQFAKSIPGFNKLSRNDQAKMLRADFLNSSAFLFYSLFNSEEGTYVSPVDPAIVINMEHMNAYTDDPEEPYRYFLLLINRMQNLELTVEEQLVSAALCFLIADADLSPIGQNIVTVNAELLSEILFQLINKNHEPEDQVFARIITILMDMKHVTHITLEYNQNMVADTRLVSLPDNWVNLVLAKDATLS